MIFDEINSCYYKTIEEILKEANDGSITKNEIIKLSSKYAFAESPNVILSKIFNEWNLLYKDDDYKTPIKNIVDIPVLLSEREWLRTIAEDEKALLFDLDKIPFLDNTVSLNQNVLYYDKPEDGDDYKDPVYINNFKTIKKAIILKAVLKIKFENRNKEELVWDCIPFVLEFSKRNDKFRLIALKDDSLVMINLARIKECKMINLITPPDFEEAKKKLKDLWKKNRAKIELRLIDNKGALERVMRQFSMLEKETIKISDTEYIVTLYYDKNDEAELLNDILMFGPYLEITRPEKLRNLIKEKIEKQKKLFGKTEK